MPNNKHTIFNNKQLAKRQISIKRNIMTKKDITYESIYMPHIASHIRMGYIYGFLFLYIFVYICAYVQLTSLPVNFIDGVTSHGTFNNQIRARNACYFWHFAYVRQSIDVHFGAVRDSGNENYGKTFSLGPRDGAILLPIDFHNLFAICCISRYSKIFLQIQHKHVLYFLDIFLL